MVDSDAPVIEYDDPDIDLNPFTFISRQDEEESPPASPTRRFSISFTLRSINSDLVIEEIPSEGVAHKIWQAGTFVTHLDQRDCPALSNLFQVRDNNKFPYRILELGAGTGIVGIAAAAILGASARVTVTDLPSVLPNLQRQIDVNAEILKSNNGNVEAKELGWGEVSHMKVLGREYDYIFATDVLYKQDLFDPLLNTLKWFMLERKNTVFLMAHLKRFNFERRFWIKAKKHFVIEEICSDKPVTGKRIGVKLYKFVVKDK